MHIMFHWGAIEYTVTHASMTQQHPNETYTYSVLPVSLKPHHVPCYTEALKHDIYYTVKHCIHCLGPHVGGEGGIVAYIVYFPAY